MRSGSPAPTGFSMLLYGPPGVGKTTLVAHLPRPLALLDLEMGSGWLVGKKGVSVFHLDEGEDPARGTANKLLDLIRSGSSPFIVVDSISSIRSRHLDHLSPGAMPTQADYGQFHAWLTHAILQSRAWRVFLVWVSTYEETLDTGRSLLRPGGLSDSNLDVMFENLDTIMFMGWRTMASGAAQRYITVAPQEPYGGRSKILVKDRTGLIPPLVDVPGDQEQLPAVAKSVFGRVVAQLGLAERRKDNA